MNTFPRVREYRWNRAAFWRLLARGRRRCEMHQRRPGGVLVDYRESFDTMKQKTETITVVVEMAITYDPTSKGAREEVIKCALRDLPNDLGGACINHGLYSVKRGRKYLMPNDQALPHGGAKKGKDEH